MLGAIQFVNLFEVPTLFYAACLTAMVTHQSTLLIQVLAWLYVAARLVHAFIHLGSNKVQRRMTVYFTGWFILLVMWGSIAAGVTAAL